MWGRDEMGTVVQGELTRLLRKQMLGTSGGGKAETSLPWTECREEL